MVTKDDVIKWVDKHKDDLLEALRESKEIPEYAKDNFTDCWCAGCFLSGSLKVAGASDSMRNKIAFVMGQRSVNGDPYKWAANYFNEFVSTGDVSDTPGLELAEIIFQDDLKPKPRR